jgi:hypothetical protein
MNGHAECDNLSGVGDLVRVEAHVRGWVRGQVRDLRLAVEGNRLVLRGRTHCFYLKQLAQQAVMQVTPFRPLANEIEVLELAADADEET